MEEELSKGNGQSYARWILLGFLILIIGGFVGYFFGVKGSITGNVIAEDKWAYTTALCKGFSCVDMMVYCIGSNVEKVELASSPVVFGGNWSDPRNITGPQTLCTNASIFNSQL